MSIKTNTTDLQALLEVANNLPTAENLDTELSTQDTLIANIMTALEGKTAGGGYSDDDIGHFYFFGEHYGSCSFIKGMTWVEFCDSVFNTGMDYYDREVITPFFRINWTYDDGSVGIAGHNSTLVDNLNSAADDNPDFDPYMFYGGPIDGYIYELESDGS